MKEITDKLDFIKMKNFYSAKYTVKRMRRHATNREEIFAKDGYLIKDCYPATLYNSITELSTHFFLPFPISADSLDHWDPNNN